MAHDACAGGTGESLPSGPTDCDGLQPETDGGDPDAGESFIEGKGRSNTPEASTARYNRQLGKCEVNGIARSPSRSHSRHPRTGFIIPCFQLMPNEASG